MRLRFPCARYKLEIGSSAWAGAESPRSNFDTFLNAFVTVFQVLTGEDWNGIMCVLKDRQPNPLMRMRAHARTPCHTMRRELLQKQNTWSCTCFRTAALFYLYSYYSYPHAPSDAAAFRCA